MGGFEVGCGVEGVVVGSGCRESERLCFPCLLFPIDVRDADCAHASCKHPSDIAELSARSFM